jgi:uncharacterized membrane protein YhaH (DUF805 family)
MSTECRVLRQEYWNKNLLNYWCLPLTYLAISCPEHLKYKFYDADIFSVHIKIICMKIIWIYLKAIIVLDITIVAYHHD